MKLSERNKILLYPFFFVAVFFVDQVSKSIAGRYVPTICNKGIAFGVGQNGLIFSSVALLIVLWFLIRERNSWRKLSLVIIFGAGFSNLSDRLFHGCVRDFINIGIIPAFNFADFLITFGVIMFLINIIKSKSDES